MSTHATEPKQVPEELLLTFFEDAAQDLNDCKIQGKDSFSTTDLQQLLLTNQRFCLDRVVNEYNNSNTATVTLWTCEQVQEALKNLDTDKLDANTVQAMEQMNEAARLSFCRLTLYSECVRDETETSQLTLESNEPLPRTVWLQFCGLCSAATRLPAVQEYVKNDTALFENVILPFEPLIPDSPPHRLDVIQRLVFQALSVDPVHGMKELQRVFFSSADNEFTDDTELLNVFGVAVQRMNGMLQSFMQPDTVEPLTDHGSGGTTRVVAVEYSEQIVDMATGKVVHNTKDPAVHSQTMQHNQEAQEQEQLQVARQAAALQQEILGELLSMPLDDRNEKLKEADAASREFLEEAMQIPAGPERITFLRSVDPQTQRLMVMHKLWQGMLAQHGGEPPVMHKEEEAARAG